MDLREFLRVLRRNWLVIAVVTLLGGAGGAAAAYGTTATYKSTTRLYFGTAGANRSVGAEYYGGLTTYQRVATYAQLVQSPLVATAIANATGLTGPIQGELSGTAPPGTFLLDVTVKDHSADRAHAIAAGFDQVFGGVINQIESGLPVGSSPFTFTVVQPATFDPVQVSPNKKLDLALGLILGFVVGLLLALLRHVLDDSVKSSGSIQADTGLATLATIPRESGARRRPLVPAGAASPRAEAFRQLRASVQFLSVHRPKRVLVVTSAATGEGKTSTVANLALSLARAGSNVILVDADLRRRKLTKLFGLPMDRGLASVLLEQTTLADSIQESHDPDLGYLLTLLGAGPDVANPSELLGSTVMSNLLTHLAQTYDYVLLDAPPVLPVADATVLAALCDGAIIVARFGHTKGQQLARVANTLKQVEAEVVGAVLTIVPSGEMEVADQRYVYSPRRRSRVATAPPVALQPATGRDDSSATSSETAPSAGDGPVARKRNTRSRGRSEPDDT